jgi:hypothetical protein
MYLYAPPCFRPTTRVATHSRGVCQRAYITLQGPYWVSSVECVVGSLRNNAKRKVSTARVPTALPEMALTSSTGTSSWFFMPISTDTSTRHASFSMYRRMFTSNFIARGGGASHARSDEVVGGGGGGGGALFWKWILLLLNVWYRKGRASKNGAYRYTGTLASSLSYPAVSG